MVAAKVGLSEGWDQLLYPSIVRFFIRTHLAELPLPFIHPPTHPPTRTCSVVVLLSVGGGGGEQWLPASNVGAKPKL